MSPGGAGRILVLGDREEVAVAAAGLVGAALDAGARTLALAGGTTPIRAYQLLAAMNLNWGRVCVLFGDERCVPPDHPDSNYLAAFEALLLQAHPASVHRMPGELGPELGAAEYTRVIRAVGPIDLALCGIGPDGHTGSLFPGHPALSDPRPVVPVRDSPKPPPARITLGLSTFRSARRVVFLATGADKADAVAAAIRGEVPAGLIEGAEWLLDRDAATRLGLGIGTHPA